MTYARSQLVEPGAPGAYHCISRCVRRAYLCGRDKYTKRSYEHRRAWVEDRLHELAGIFAVGLYGYAVMNNHAHVVLTVSPATANGWSAEAIAERWVRLFPSKHPEDNGVRRALIEADPARVAKYRERLGDLSWFMRCLNEPIARRANKEDKVKGRFWEGRFESQVLLDERAMLAALTYVDLNPIRAKIAKDVATSKYTSVAKRARQLRKKEMAPTSTLRPLAGRASWRADQRREELSAPRAPGCVACARSRRPSRTADGPLHNAGSGEDAHFDLGLLKWWVPYPQPAKSSSINQAQTNAG